MITYTTGDLLKSSADALVNTVNCEGYMGKGIAYQFKLQFPKNNEDYVRACKNGSLRIGKLHYFKERGKIIINFPTKNKWRAKSKIEYIQSGLIELVILIKKLNIKSIAIPPLGSGNGGLIWSEVKKLIEDHLVVIDKDISIFIYEPSHGYASQPMEEPKLSLSALTLMQMKSKLKKFDALRLQKTAYLVNIFLYKRYFNFARHKYGPYDNSIAVISKKIKEFQQYHNVQNTNEAYFILYNKIVSDTVETKLKELSFAIEKATAYVNSIDQNHELECLSTILFILEEEKELSEEKIVELFRKWSEDKAERFSEIEVSSGIKKLYDTNIIERTLMGYSISNIN